MALLSLHGVALDTEEELTDVPVVSSTVPPVPPVPPVATEDEVSPSSERDLTSEFKSLKILKK